METATTAHTARYRAPRTLLPFLLLALGPWTAALAIPPPDAVGSLHHRGTGRYLCTASVVAGGDLGLAAELVVLTAAHCVEAGLHLNDGGLRWGDRVRYLLSFDNLAYYEVEPLRLGSKELGYDIAVLTFRDDPPEVTPLRMGSWEAVDFGSEVHNFANPLGMGLQYFSGAVTMLRIEPSPAVRSSQRGARHNAVASLQVGPGSSGSLILNAELEYIGILSSVIDPGFGSPFTVFVPQWKFAAFLADEALGHDVLYAEGPQDGQEWTPLFASAAWFQRPLE